MILRQITGFLMIICLLFSCDSERSNVKSDLVASNLKGKIWKIQRTIYKVGDKVKCPACQRDNDKNSFYVYDAEGKLIKCSEMDENGDTVLVSRYIYNHQGVCTEIDKYSGGKITGKLVNLLQGGRVTEVKEYNEEGTVENIYKYEYAENEISAGKVLNKSGDVVSSFNYEYLNGQICSQIEKNGTGDLWTVTKYKRNSNNDIIETIKSYPNDASEYKPTFEYEYDNLRNWVKQTQYYEGEIAGIVVRNLTYFNK
jgi:hypothetical protein